MHHLHGTFLDCPQLAYVISLMSLTQQHFALLLQDFTYAPICTPILTILHDVRQSAGRNCVILIFYSSEGLGIPQGLWIVNLLGTTISSISIQTHVAYLLCTLSKTSKRTNLAHLSSLWISLKFFLTIPSFRLHPSLHTWSQQKE